MALRSAENVKLLLKSLIFEANDDLRIESSEDKTEADKTGTESDIANLQRKPYVLALDKEEFYKRVKTFTSSWYGKPQWLSPLVCSAYGWRLVEGDVLQCVTCRACVSARVAKNFSPEIHEESCRRIKDSLTSSHSKCCPWPSHPTPVSVYSEPSVTQSEAVTHFTERVSGLLQCQSHLPMTKEESLPQGVTSDDVSLWCRSMDLTAESSVDEQIEAMYVSACVLALTGWQYHSEKLIDCPCCLRSLGLWHFVDIASHHNSAGSQEVPLSPVTSEANTHKSPEYMSQDITADHSMPQEMSPRPCEISPTTSDRNSQSTELITSEDKQSPGLNQSCDVDEDVRMEADDSYAVGFLEEIMAVDTVIKVRSDESVGDDVIVDPPAVLPAGPPAEPPAETSAEPPVEPPAEPPVDGDDEKLPQHQQSEMESDSKNEHYVNPIHESELSSVADKHCETDNDLGMIQLKEGRETTDDSSCNETTETDGDHQNENQVKADEAEIHPMCSTCTECNDSNNGCDNESDNDSKESPVSQDTTRIDIIGTEYDVDVKISENSDLSYQILHTNPADINEIAGAPKECEPPARSSSSSTDENLAELDSSPVMPAAEIHISSFIEELEAVDNLRKMMYEAMNEREDSEIHQVMDRMLTDIEAQVPSKPLSGFEGYIVSTMRVVTNGEPAQKRQKIAATRKYFNGIEEHHVWCPWVSSPNPKSQPGYKTMIQHLFNYSQTKPSPAKVSTLEGLRNVRSLLKNWT